jgi:hypothetical protein
VSFLVGLLMSVGGGIWLLRLVYQHFGPTGLMFVGAYIVMEVGNALIKASSDG